MKNLLKILTLFVLLVSCKQVQKSNKKENVKKPNIVIIYADDLGYGDVSSYGAVGLTTPNMDRIANEGIRFTNGYATSPTCTPSRFAMLSGIYPFRQNKAKILPGDAPLLFDVNKQSLPSMLKGAGYTTGAVGKWHLGFGNGGLDWNGKIAPGPLEIGFDECFLMASTNDRVPSVYVKDHKVNGLTKEDPIYVSYKKNFDGEPTGRKNPEMLKVHPSHGHDMSIHNGISRIGFMKGGKSALFTDEDMGDDFLRESLAFVERNQDKPFFLFYALHQPHVPRIPHPRFAGKSGLGPRGDVILEADYEVGAFLDKLDELGIADNTIVLFSSDNGPVLDDGYMDDAVTKIGNHKPAGPFRGGKYSLFEAGTRVPFMIRWPNQIKPGVSDALVCQIDFLGSFAALLNQKNQNKDSQNILDAFTGKSKKGRKSLVLGQKGLTAFKQGDWILIPPHKGKKIVNKWVNIETGKSKAIQLYNIKEDINQQNNLAEAMPDKVAQMMADLAAASK